MIVCIAMLQITYKLNSGTHTSIYDKNNNSLFAHIETARFNSTRRNIEKYKWTVEIVVINIYYKCHCNI